MALIKCPECGKEVSDKAPACIHCGFPMNIKTYTSKKHNQKIICIIDGNEYDFSSVANELLKTNDSLEGMKIIRRICNMSPTDARKFFSIINTSKQIPTEYETTLYMPINQNSKSNKASYKEKKDEKICLPKCPTCSSTDIKKVSTASKAGSVALWGIFSQKVKKTWHCNNCSYEW